MFFAQAQPDPERLPILSAPLQPPPLSGGDVNAAWMRRALKDLRLEILELRRDQARTELEASSGGPVPVLELVAKTPAFDAAAPRVSVLTALYNHASLVPAALASAVRSQDCACEMIVVDDGSSDGSSEAVTEWMTQHQDIPALLLRHPVNRGLAHARNDALSLARGEFCFVLDADNEVYPHCLSRLLEAMEADPLAAFAYGTLERFSGSECLGLLNTLPWEPQRLRVGNYIDAMAMMRTSVILGQMGGYPTDRRLHGWEDYALWCALASAGHYAVRVPEILARYRIARHSMLSLTNISSTDAFSVIIESNPVLMAGVQAPD
jgi:Glycosyl transferase family 2